MQTIFGGRKFPLKHRPDGLSAFNRFLRYLMIDRGVVLELGQATSSPVSPRIHLGLALPHGIRHGRISLVGLWWVKVHD